LAHPTWRAAGARGASFALLWIVLMPSAKPGDLAMGAFAAACATWASLHLLPPARTHVRIGRLLGHVPRLLVASVVAGVDVALRAFSPRPRVQPGFVDHPTAMPRGLARTTFATVTSLLPGTLPAGERDATIVYHALDVAQPVAEELRAEEERLRSALDPGARS
jgi:multicomponent Na+:H+ antiporter subunit E